MSIFHIISLRPTSNFSLSLGKHWAQSLPMGPILLLWSEPSGLPSAQAFHGSSVMGGALTPCGHRNLPSSAFCPQRESFREWSLHNLKSTLDPQSHSMRAHLSPSYPSLSLWITSHVNHLCLILASCSALRQRG